MTHSIRIGEYYRPVSPEYPELREAKMVKTEGGEPKPDEATERYDRGLLVRMKNFAKKEDEANSSPWKPLGINVVNT